MASLVLAGLAAGAFAQDAPAAPTVKISGYASTGVSVAANGTDKAVIGLWDDDNGGQIGRFNLGVKFAQGDSGFNFEIRGDKATVTSAVYMKSVYAYTNLFDKMVYTQAGIINEQTSRANGDASIRTSFTKETPGIIFLARPMDGVTLNTALVSLPTSGVVNLNEVNAELGGTFVAQGLTQIKGGLLFANGNAGVAGKDANYGLGRAYVAASLDAVSNLKFWLEGFFAGYDSGTAATTTAGSGALSKASGTSYSKYLNGPSSVGITVLAETAKYGFADFDMPALTVGLKSYQYVYGSDLKTGSGDTVNPSYLITPWVSYALDGGIVPKLAVSYFAGAEVLSGSYSQYNSNLQDNVLTYQAPTPAKGAIANQNNIALFEIKPSVQFNVGATQSITVVYAYDMSVGSDDAYFTDGYAASTAKSNSIFQINYIYSF